MHISDWLPTLCEVTGTETPPKLVLDGQSIWPFLTKEKKVADKRPIYWKIRSHYAVREGNWKLMINRNTNKVELYDLENDFRETRDLSETNPEKTAYLIELLEGFKEKDREK